MPRSGGFANAAITERKTVGVEDMTMLSDVQNEAIYSNLETRFGAKEIYTYIGEVLIVCNPFEWLRIYDTPYIKMYENGVRADLAPHIFAVAEASFRNMLLEEEKQCIIISGESGAGKTEAAKQVMNYIAAVSGSGAGDRKVTEVKQIVVESNPALEAFGNAMTLRNNNSSRFGKYFELKFDLANGGTPRGGFVTNYLLEKSRVVHPGPGERSFHIFYQLCRGAPRDVQANLGLTDPEAFRVLAVSGVSEIDNDGGRVDDAKEFQETVHSMQTIGLFPEDQFDFFLIVAVCMHISNVDFYAANVDGAEGSQIADSRALDIVAGLLEVDYNALAYALTYRTLTTMAPGGKLETYQVPLNPTQAQAARDALAKDLYSRMFDRLVGKVNTALENTGNNTRVSLRREARQVSDNDGLSIGVLDIYGFEIFESNHFEQFCINYVNEKLQQIFIELTIKLEQETYASEGIQWQAIPYFDNKVVCDLIESKKPPGVFAILDDTIKTAHALGNADDKFLEKLNTFHSSHAHFSKFRGGFSILHYAGRVNYSCEGFVEANKDTLNQDLQLLAQSSTNAFVAGLYPEKVDLDQRRQPTSAGYKIKRQCGDLVYTLMDCAPHYVRCVKSNDEKRAGLFDHDRVLYQVMYLGLLENVKVRRAGFATRMEFDRFIARFKVLGAGMIDPYVLAHGSDYDIAAAILDVAAQRVPELTKAGEAQLGRTMVFIKTPETFFKLQELRKSLVGEQAIKIQHLWRRYANRRDLVSLRSEMSDLWQERGKEATPADLLRNYYAFYIKDKTLLEAIGNLLDWFQSGELKKERLQYTEQLMRLNAHGRFEPVVFVLTDSAMYIAYWQPKSGQTRSTQTSRGARPTNGPYELYLRRRTSLKNIESVLLSLEADDLVAIQCTPQEKLKKPIKDNFVEKKKVKRCQETQQPFSFFGASKHQCNYGGGVYVKEVMAPEKIPLPDRGFYTPVEVHSSVPGTVSVEMREDFVVMTEKKAEIVAMLRNLVTLAKGGAAQMNKLDREAIKSQAVTPQDKPMARALYDFTATEEGELDLKEGDKVELLDTAHSDWWLGRYRGHEGLFPAAYVEKLAAPIVKPKRANPKRYKLEVNFDNLWYLRQATVPSLSNTPKGPIEFHRNENISEMSLRPSGGKLVVQVPLGVAGRKLREIQAAQAERHAKREAERQELFELRRQNAQRRDAQRREDREKRLEAKKAKRRDEKAKRDKESDALNFGARNAAMGGASFAARMEAQSNSASKGRPGGGSSAAPPPWVTARSNKAAAAPKPAAPPPKKEKWEAYRDDDSGDIYYYNADTGETTWDKPRGFTGKVIA